MPFYQNPFDSDFRGNWILDDRQYSLVFKCPANLNHNDLMFCWNLQPYNLSTNNTLTIWYAFDPNFQSWAPLSINVAGATPSATLASEVVTALQANEIFNDYFVASLGNNNPGNAPGTNQPANQVMIRSIKPKHQFKFYIDNGGAEQALSFNKYAGIADLPSYFDRHTIANRYTYSDSVGMLVRISQSITAISAANPAVVTSANHGLTNGQTVYIDNSDSSPSINGAQVVTVVDTNNFSVPVNVSTAGTRGEWLSQLEYNIINNNTKLNLNPLSMMQDWQHLSGGSNTFLFTNTTLDGSGRPSVVITYHAGSVAGDLSTRTVYVYSGAFTTPVNTFILPHQLQAGDLITPP